MWPHTDKCESFRWNGDLGKEGCFVCYIYVFARQLISILRIIIKRVLGGYK